MKTFCLISILAVLLIALIIPTELNAQIQPLKSTCWASKTFANSGKDTLGSTTDGGTIKRIASAPFISHELVSDDTVSVITKIQYRSYFTTTWTTISTDTLAGDGAQQREKVLRDATHDLVAGVSGYLRVIHLFAASGTPVTGNTYSSYFYSHP